MRAITPGGKRNISSFPWVVQKQIQALGWMWGRYVGLPVPAWGVRTASSEGEKLTVFTMHFLHLFLTGVLQLGILKLHALVIIWKEKAGYKSFNSLVNLTID